MRLRVVSLFLSCSAIAAVWACALNPQPLPPDGYDASADTSLGMSPDGSGGADGAADDGTVPTSGEAGVDSGAIDSGDAGVSDAGDAGEDARDDDASDSEADAGDGA